MRQALAAATLAALAGCSGMSVGVSVGVPVGGHGSVGVGTSVFGTPAGASANRRVGELIACEPVSVHVDDGARALPAGLELVSRDRELRPSAILRVTETRQGVTFAEVVLGKPAVGDEVVEASESYRREVGERLASR